MIRNTSNIAGFLADTWWFGLSKRLPEQGFKDLAALRATQGFSAIQLVVGVPPEVGPENENAQSLVGFPWTLDGHSNPAYLELAQDRIRYLNKLGFIVIVYGAWGHQIDWLGPETMTAWWLKVIQSLDSLNIVYCLCGESNLWVGEAAKLLPDKSTGDLAASRASLMLHPRLRELLLTVARRLRRQWRRHQFEKRRRDWGSVLQSMSQKTGRPIIVHPTADETGYEAVPNPELLSANTAQTGHAAKARNRLWQLPLALQKKGRADKGYINLEPWYEGIGNQFWAQDQMFAYWVTMMAGAISYCYGAHGIWNVGDGKFLAQWGKQTFALARALDTPRLIGLSHKQFMRWGGFRGELFYQTAGRDLITIGRKAGDTLIQFFPDIARARHIPVGEIWLPLEGAFAETVPTKGQAVVFSRR